MSYLLDTSVLIEAIRTRDFDAEIILREKYAGKAFISAITVAELFAGRSVRDENMEKYLRYLVDSFETIEFNKEAAIEMGLTRLKYDIDVVDAIIASAAIQNNLILATHNKKHFTKIKNLKIA